MHCVEIILIQSHFFGSYLKSRWVGTAATVSSTSSKSPKVSTSDLDSTGSEDDTFCTATGRQLSEIMKSHLNMKESEFGKLLSVVIFH